MIYYLAKLDGKPATPYYFLSRKTAEAFAHKIYDVYPELLHTWTLKGLGVEPSRDARLAICKEHSQEGEPDVFLANRLDKPWHEAHGWCEILIPFPL